MLFCVLHHAGDSSQIGSRNVNFADHHCFIAGIAGVARWPQDAVTISLTVP
jgi:hypothetical protein